MITKKSSKNYAILHLPTGEYVFKHNDVGQLDVFQDNIGCMYCSKYLIKHIFEHTYSPNHDNVTEQELYKWNFSTELVKVYPTLAIFTDKTKAEVAIKHLVKYMRNVETNSAPEDHISWLYNSIPKADPVFVLNKKTISAEFEVVAVSKKNIKLISQIRDNDILLFDGDNE